MIFVYLFFALLGFLVILSEFTVLQIFAIVLFVLGTVLYFGET